MTRFSAKITSLLLMMFISLPTLANSPWATAEEAPQQDPAPVTEQGQDITDQVFGDRPATPQEIPQSEPEPIMPEPEVLSDTQSQDNIQGDVLNVPNNTTTPAQVKPVHVVDFPRRGMSTDKVQNELGKPGEIIPAIGQPPITRWIYNDRIVYFEYATVLHVVAK